MTETTALPIWVLIIFCITLIGVITLIYSRGSWRTALAFVSLAIMVVLIIAGIDAWNDYIKTHFVGQFDQLGIPFREAGPGWTLLYASWPIWLVPTGIFTLLASAAGWWLHQHFAQSVLPTTSAEITPITAIPAVEKPLRKGIAGQLELESLKQELTAAKEKLATAIEIAEEQVDKNQDLEIQIAQLEEEQAEALADWQDRIAALELEISAKENQNDDLTLLTLQQAEAIAKFKERLENNLQNDQ